MVPSRSDTRQNQSGQVDGRRSRRHYIPEPLSIILIEHCNLRIQEDALDWMRALNPKGSNHQGSVEAHGQQERMVGRHFTKVDACHDQMKGQPTAARRFCPVPETLSFVFPAGPPLKMDNDLIRPIVDQLSEKRSN